MADQYPNLPARPALIAETPGARSQWMLLSPCGAIALAFCRIPPAAARNKPFSARAAPRNRASMQRNRHGCSSRTLLHNGDKGQLSGNSVRSYCCSPGYFNLSCFVTTQWLAMADRAVLASQRVPEMQAGWG